MIPGKAMTESQWLVCSDPEQMFKLIGDRDSVRQSRSLLREILLPLVLRDCDDEQARWVRKEIDLWVDDQQRCKFPKVLSDRIGLNWPKPDGCRKEWEPQDPDRCLARRLSLRLDDEVKSQVCSVLRDLFGTLLFRSITLDHFWLTSDVVALAETIYQDRQFDRLPILAGTLQHAGCNNDEILSHLKGPGPHFRGCWVIDLLTNRN